MNINVHLLSTCFAVLLDLSETHVVVTSRPCGSIAVLMAWPYADRQLSSELFPTIWYGVAIAVFWTQSFRVQLDSKLASRRTVSSTSHALIPICAPAGRVMVKAKLPVSLLLNLDHH